MLIVLKSGSLNLLETSGPVQGCNGIALPCFYIILTVHTRKNKDFFYLDVIYFLLLSKDHSKDYEKGGVRGIIRERRERHTNIWWGTRKKEDFEDLVVDDRVI